MADQGTPLEATGDFPILREPLRMVIKHINKLTQPKLILVDYFGFF